MCDDAFGLADHRTALSWLPLFHDMGLAAGLTVPLSLGMHSVLMAPFAFVQRPARWMKLIDRYRATFSAVPNFALELCADRVTEDELRDVDLSCLSVLLNGSEPVRPTAVRRFATAFRPYGLRPESHTPCYGLAEATILVTAKPRGTRARTLRCDQAALADGKVVPTGDGRELAGCGVAAGRQVRIVDPVTCEELPPDQVGEVWVHGPNVAAGYLTGNEVFRARLRGTGGPDWLRTGDLGFLYDGQLYLTGRLKDLIVISGRNHHPVDIEASVETAGQGVRAGHVAAFSVDAPGGERLVVVAEAERRDVNADELRRAVRRVLAACHGLDLHDLLLVRRGSVPKTSSGKVRRAEARRRYLDGELSGKAIA